MKKIALLMATAALFSLTACDNDDDKTPEKVVVEDGTYKGTISVDQNDGTFYTQNDVEMKITLSADGKKAEIELFKVGFSTAMPLKLDMTIPGVTVEEVTDGLKISGDQIVPLAFGGTEYPAFTITGMEGKVTPETISFEMTCGEFPLTFSGTVVKTD